MLPLSPHIPALGRLLRFPTTDFHSQLEALIHAPSPPVRQELAAFQVVIASLPLVRVRELYTRTFDLSPVCVPYISVHLFGEESFQRARLMTGLATSYAEAGLTPERELPDHIGLFLTLAPHIEREVWEDALELLLPHALKKMRKALERAESPWLYIIRALEAVLEHEPVLPFTQESYHG